MGKLIEAKGHKAFRGTMRINWDGKPHEEIYGDWIYTKDGPFGFWHYKEWSYPASVCEIVETGGHWRPDSCHPGHVRDTVCKKSEKEMREIFFRGKPKKLKDYGWVTGQLLYHQGDISKIYSNEIDYPAGVIPETVGQFSGWTDENRKQIFEGDIVEPTLSDGTHSGFSWGLQVVIFDRGAFCLKDLRGEITPMCNYAANVKFKVLGNIYDNPEMVEE